MTAAPRREMAMTGVRMLSGKSLMRSRDVDRSVGSECVQNEAVVKREARNVRVS